MRHELSLEPVDEIDADARVCHYDELDEAAKERLPLIADGEEGVDGSVVEGFGACDVVKYTDYYEVSSS
ncbi:hypothetical protein ACFQGT_11210 [Natrialbaceae archaeon GCM10025810]|uniref:hypothetical protein n=1 Tax=Halovalidus salilacus TaxID=3075124 RepID=UPI00360ADF2A